MFFWDILAEQTWLALPYWVAGIPIAAALAHKGARQNLLAAFMMSSVLINPQLLIYTAALGPGLLVAHVGMGCG